jgi:hypothetical protein
MIGAALSVTRAAAGVVRRVRKSTSSPARASAAAKTRIHGGRESRASSGASLGTLGACTGAGVGGAAGTIARAAGRERALDATLVGCIDATRSPGRLTVGKEGVLPAAGLEGGRVLSDRVSSFWARPDVRLPRTGRATTVAAAPAGAAPRKTSSAGVASTGVGSTATGAGC